MDPAKDGQPGSQLHELPDEFGDPDHMLDFDLPDPALFHEALNPSFSSLSTHEAAYPPVPGPYSSESSTTQPLDPQPSEPQQGKGKRKAPNIQPSSHTLSDVESLPSWRLDASSLDPWAIRFAAPDPALEASVLPPVSALPHVPLVTREVAASSSHRQQKKRRRETLPHGGQGGIVSKLSDATGGGASALKTFATILRFCPDKMRTQFIIYLNGLNSDQFVALYQKLKETLLQKSMCPPQSLWVEVFNKIKTRAHTKFEFRGFSNKLRGDSSFHIYKPEDGTWEARYTKDPPWSNCIKLEFKQILAEYQARKHEFQRDSIEKLHEFLNETFYDKLAALVGISTEAAAGGPGLSPPRLSINPFADSHQSAGPATSSRNVFVSQPKTDVLTNVPPWHEYVLDDYTGHNKPASLRKCHEVRATAICYLINFLTAIPPIDENISAVIGISDQLHMVTRNYHRFNKNCKVGAAKFDYLFCGVNFGEYANGMQDKFKTAVAKDNFVPPTPKQLAAEFTRALKMDPKELLAERKQGSKVKIMLTHLLEAHWHGSVGNHGVARWRELLDQIVEEKMEQTQAVQASRAVMDSRGLAVVPSEPDAAFVVFIRDRRSGSPSPADVKVRMVGRAVSVTSLKQCSARQLVDSVVPNHAGMGTIELYDVAIKFHGPVIVNHGRTSVDLYAHDVQQLQLCHKEIVISDSI